MTFIETVPEDEATGKLRELYDQDLKTLGYVAAHTKAMSLRPEAIEAYNQLGRAVRSRIRLREYELLTLAVSRTLRCTY